MKSGTSFFSIMGNLLDTMFSENHIRVDGKILFIGLWSFSYGSADLYMVSGVNCLSFMSS